MVLVVQENNKVHQIPNPVPRGVFRTYDIRGPVGENSISSGLAYAIGLAFGSMSLREGQPKVFVGRDGRLTGEVIQGALIQGLLETGCHVVNLGIISTPMLYFATLHQSTCSGVMVTASHNPAGDNGFKSVLQGNTLTSAGVDAIYDTIMKRDFISGEGQLESQSVLSAYQQAVCSKVSLDRPLKVVIDSGNGVGSVAAPQVLRDLGCEVIELYSEIDGRFPNHHPDPTVEKNCQDLITAVKKENADCGLAFDGDADRVGVVTNEGKIIWPDRLMMLFSKAVLAKYPEREIIFDVKCSRDLARVIERSGGKPVMYKTGHSLIKAQMKSLNAPLAGEMSGHIFFNDRWFGFDDGLYVGVRLLEIIAAQPDSCAAIFDALPDSVNTPELKLAMPDEHKADFMAQVMASDLWEGAEKITIDGLRVEYPDGWGLVRPSNTSPYLTLRFEAISSDALKALQQRFAEVLLSIDAKLLLPF